MNMKSAIMLLLLAVSLSGCSIWQNKEKDDKAAANLKQASITNVQLGVGYIRRGQYEVAEQKLLKAIELDSNNVDAYTTMAFLLMQIEKMDEAGEYYLDALEIKGNDPELHNGYGAYLCRVGRVDEAMEEFKLAYSNPFYKAAFLAYSNAGTCLLQADRYEPAEKMLRNALKLQPELSGALISMAELSIKTEKYLSSRGYIQRYHVNNRPSAESLWVQVQAERALGAKEHYRKYANQLLNEFPDSEQASLARELERRDRIKQN